MSLTLPTSKIPAVSENPRYLILYGLPKAGKTSCLAQLDNNLIIDLEEALSSLMRWPSSVVRSTI